MLKLPSGKEVDFIEGDAALDEASMLVQVCFDMTSPKTQEREVAVLKEAMVRFGQTEELVLTFDDEFDVPVEGGVVKVRPAWKWLLNAEGGNQPPKPWHGIAHGAGKDKS